MMGRHQAGGGAEGHVAAWIASHRKVLAAIAGGLVTVAVTIWGTDAAWVQALILAATAAGVYRLPNTAAPRPIPRAPKP